MNTFILSLILKIILNMKFIRLTETAKLLKSAFSFTRNPTVATPYRKIINYMFIFSWFFISYLNLKIGGFAFSQEENGVVRQSDLIRVYNSNIDKPTGN
jgi:hypothetical protein